VSPPEIPSAATGGPCRALAKRGEVCLRVQDENVDRLRFIGGTKGYRQREAQRGGVALGDEGFEGGQDVRDTQGRDALATTDSHGTGGG